MSSPPRRNNDNTDDTPSKPDLLAWAQNLSFRLRSRRNDEGMELEERRLAVVEVAPTRGKPVSTRFFSISDVRLDMYHAENILAE